MPKVIFETKEDYEYLLDLEKNKQLIYQITCTKDLVNDMKELAEFRKIGTIKEYNQAGDKMAEQLDLLEEFLKIGETPEKIKEVLETAKEAFIKKMNEADNLDRQLRLNNEWIEDLGGREYIKNLIQHHYNHCNKYDANSNQEINNNPYNKVSSNNYSIKVENLQSELKAIKDNYNKLLKDFNSCSEDYLNFQREINRIGDLDYIKRAVEFYNKKGSDNLVNQIEQMGGIEKIIENQKTNEYNAKQLNAIILEQDLLIKQINQLGGIETIKHSLIENNQIKTYHKELVDKITELGGFDVIRDRLKILDNFNTNQNELQTAYANLNNEINKLGGLDYVIQTVHTFEKNLVKS